MRLPAFLILALLVGCSQPVERAADSVGDAAESVGDVVSDPIHDTQTVTAEITTPVVIAMQEAAAVVTAPLPEVAPAPAVDPAAVALIVSFEVVSPAYYTKRLQGIICPGGASGPTGGIGSDFGQQTQDQIRRDWAIRSDVDRLASASGFVGPARCREKRTQLADVRIPLQQATTVFEGAVLPAYHRATRRAYGGDLFDALPPRAAGAMDSEHFNRGGPSPGSRGKEQRAIRDDCIPRGDVACIAAQLRSMCRIWKNTELEAGLCRRREAEARLATS